MQVDLLSVTLQTFLSCSQCVIKSLTSEGVCFGNLKKCLEWFLLFPNLMTLHLSGRPNALFDGPEVLVRSLSPLGRVVAARRRRIA
jgi:hypothetical protein